MSGLTVALPVAGTGSTQRPVRREIFVRHPTVTPDRRVLGVIDGIRENEWIYNPDACQENKLIHSPFVDIKSYLCFGGMCVVDGGDRGLGEGGWCLFQ